MRRGQMMSCLTKRASLTDSIFRRATRTHTRRGRLTNITPAPTRTRPSESQGKWWVFVSTRFFTLDQKKTDQKISAYAQRLAEDPRVVAVVLFGSHARGDATAISDIDVLILLSQSGLPFHQRIPEFLYAGAGLSMDLFPYTLEEARTALREGWGVTNVALREGLWLVDKAGIKELLSGGGHKRRA